MVNTQFKWTAEAIAAMFAALLEGKTQDQVAEQIGLSGGRSAVGAKVRLLATKGDNRALEELARRQRLTNARDAKRKKGHARKKIYEVKAHRSLYTPVISPIAGLPVRKTPKPYEPYHCAAVVATTEAGGARYCNEPLEHPTTVLFCTKHKARYLQKAI